MDGFHLRLLYGLYNPVHVQIAVHSRSRSDKDRFISGLDMETIPVHLGINRD